MEPDHRPDEDDAPSEPPCGCPVQRCGDTCQCHGTCTCYWHDTGQHYVLASNDCPPPSTPARQARATTLPSDHHTQKFSPPETTSTESMQRGKCSGTAAECFAETGLGDLQYWSPTLNADGSFEFDFQRGTP